MWYIKKLEYLKYLIEYLRRMEILAHATTWMNPEAITFSEISQSHKDEYYYDSAYLWNLG